MTKDLPDDDAMFDDYLDLALAGRAQDPQDFLARHPDATPDVRRRIEDLFRAMGSGQRTPAPGGHDDPSHLASLPSFSDYDLIKPLGEGGMGRVFLARQKSLDRLVALKVVRPDLQGSARAMERFRREAHALARLDHPHVLRVHAYGEEHGVAFLVTELAEGRSLADVLESWRGEGLACPIPRVGQWLVQVADALAHAHRAGVVHRDVKPGNIWIRETGEALLLDFGLVRMKGADFPSLTDQFMGSPVYVSPEQVKAQATDIDHRTDLYSLGATLYEALTLRPPFNGSVRRILHDVLHAPPRPPRALNPSIPVDLQTVVQTAMEKEPERRYASASELASDLRSALEFRTIKARPAMALTRLRRWARRHVAATAAALTLILATITWSAWRVDQSQRQKRDDHARFERHVTAARGLVDQLSDFTDQQIALEREIEDRSLFPGCGTTSDDTERLSWLDGRVSIVRREVRSLETQITHQLLSAERLEPDDERVQRLRASRYATLWRAAASARRHDDASDLAALVEHHDVDGTFASSVIRHGRLTLTTNPPGATVHLFRYRMQADVDPDGEYRIVPCPLVETPDFRPGQVALRVMEPSETLQPHDLIVSIDGHPIDQTAWVIAGRGPVEVGDRWVSTDGQPRAPDPIGEVTRARWNVWAATRFGFETGDGFIELQHSEMKGLLTSRAETFLAVAGPLQCDVLRGGRLEQISVPPTTVVRRTATPLLIAPETVVGTTPLELEQLPLGEYIGLVRRDGFEDARFTFDLHAGMAATTHSLPLVPEGTAPADMVYIADGPSGPFWMSDHEVTAGEYLRFLRERESQWGGRAIAPFMTPPPGMAPVVVRDGSGELQHSLALPPRAPMVGVSTQATLEFIRWKNEVDANFGLTYALPSPEEWMHAARGRTSRHYVYGNHAQSGWANTDGSGLGDGRAPRPLYVRQFDRDVSPYGVYDLAGNASEWCIEPPGSSDPGRILFLGASFTHPTVGESRIDRAISNGAIERDVWGFVGIRLAAHRTNPSPR